MLRTHRSLSWLVVPLLLLGACGSEPQQQVEEVTEEEARFADLVAASGDRLLDEGTARVSSTMAVEMPDAAGGGLMAGTGRGAFDYEAKTGYFTMKMTFSGMPMLGNMTTKSIMDFPHVYMNMSDMLQQFGGGTPPQLKPWIRINFNTVGEQVGIDMGALMRFGQSDASSYVLYTKGVEDVSKVGRERVRGEPATHYEAILDFEKLQEEDIPEDVRSSLQAIVQLMGTSEVPFDVWLDKSGRMVRQRMEMPMPVGATGQTAPTTIDMTYYGFGREVHVELPPERQVMDLEELLELGSQPGAYESQGGSDTDGA